MILDGCPFPALTLKSGDVLYYLGKKRNLIVIRDERSRAKVKHVMGRILLWVPYEADYAYRREQLEKWYRKEAVTVLTQKVYDYAEILNVSFENIRIKDQKSRWGSCSSKRNLNFNWRILMAPEPVCDYVIIHELCHLIHMDHSPDFWKKVAEISPEYEQHKKWLRDNVEILYSF